MSNPSEIDHWRDLFYCLYIERKFVILHGFRKQSMKTREKEIATAICRMKELMESGKWFECAQPVLSGLHGQGTGRRD